MIYTTIYITLSTYDYIYAPLVHYSIFSQLECDLPGFFYVLFKSDFIEMFSFHPKSYYRIIINAQLWSVFANMYRLKSLMLDNVVLKVCMDVEEAVNVVWI